MIEQAAASKYVVPSVFPVLGVAQAIEIPGGFLSSAVQLLVSAGFAGLVVQLLLIRQNRRKIEGEASSNEASAASTLSGAALKMVENAQASEAKAQADCATARREVAEARREAQRYWGDLNAERWRSHDKDMRIAALESLLRQAQIEVPPAPSPTVPPSFPPPGHLDEAPSHDDWQGGL